MQNPYPYVSPPRTEPVLLGTVGLNGAIYFTGDIVDCREFLEQRGLESLPRGWFGDGWRGLIEYCPKNCSYYAAVWQED